MTERTEKDISNSPKVAQLKQENKPNLKKRSISFFVAFVTREHLLQCLKLHHKKVIG